MKHTCYLILGHSEKIPGNVSSEEMILLSEGFEGLDTEGSIPPDLCACMTSFVARADGPESAFEKIQTAWREWTGAAIELELITANPHRITKERKQAFEDLESRDFSYQVPFVVFRKDSDKALHQAKDLILGCATRKIWEVWK